MSRLLSLVALVLLLGAPAGCAVGRYAQRGAPTQPFDLVVVPGCPSEWDGRLSACQRIRALWAAVVWERGWARAFVTSGAAVHSPSVEAEALAAAMVALGIPAERIYLERAALHTDENMYGAMKIAQAIGAKTLAVAASKGQALFGCAMMSDWGQECRALGLERSALEERLRQGAAARLDDVRSPVIAPWDPPIPRERAEARAQRRSPRPPSLFLYPAMAWRRLAGEPYVPPAPRVTPRVTFADLLRPGAPGQTTAQVTANSVAP
jgi:hypothetical protein